ncbi:RING-H2 finger protein ATL1C [Hordeum vulgare]|nr:RING-H2 finger protein ATL1C [Hordeum vulgare]
MMTTLFGQVDGVPGLIMAWFGIFLLTMTFLGPIFIGIAACLCRGGQRAEEENAPVGRLAALLVAIERAQQMRTAAVAPAPAPAPEVELGYFPYSGEGRRASERLVCAICLEELQRGQACSEVPACRHVFHRDCINVWMKSKTTCPLCRRNIVAGSERISVAFDMV